MNPNIIAIVMMVNLFALNCLIGFMLYAFSAKNTDIKASNLQIIEKIQNYNEASQELRRFKDFALNQKDNIVQDVLKAKQGKLIEAQKQAQRTENNATNATSTQEFVNSKGEIITKEELEERLREYKKAKEQAELNNQQ